MIRGAVEQVADSRVSGWIYSTLGDLRGATLLAFVDDVCIGAGKVEIFRQDLADAGLGDGRFGFSFPVSLERPNDAACLVVKLEGSDALLKQSASRIRGSVPTPVNRPSGALALPLAVLQWMQTRGWLGQSEYDFLRYFSQLGVYDRSLSSPIEHPDRIEVRLLEPELVVADLFGLITMSGIELLRVTVPSIGDISALVREKSSKDHGQPIVALWSENRARLDVIEGSHNNFATPGDGAREKASVEYALGPDRVLFLDPRIAFGKLVRPPPGGIDVFLIGDSNKND